MATMYEPYKTKTNENIAERRETDYKPPSSVKNTVDNSNSVLYNESKENNVIKTPVTDFAKEWKDKNKSALKYAGDSAKKSINAGLEEASSFMRDADEGTSFEKVQDASVKWKLAVDAQNDSLFKSASNEMIGHLSSENKDIYLEDAQPLQTYIDAKDEFDYKNNNYTTTQNVDTTPDENVRTLQRELNERGYTDKFGQKLKEDGIYAGKTAYADDTSKKYSKETAEAKAREKYGDLYDVLAFNEKGEPAIGPKFLSAVKPTELPKIPTVYGNSYNVEYPLDIKGNLNKLESSSNTTNNQYDYKKVKNLIKNGTLSPGDEAYNQLKQTMIKRLSANWYRNDGNSDNQTKIQTQANKLRAFDDNSFQKAVFMNKSDGAGGFFGHTGVMLMNKDGYALVFSIYSDEEGIPLDNAAEMRFSVLTPNQAKRVLEGDGYIFDMAASDGDVRTEVYDRFVTYDITNGQGYNMYYHAVNIYKDPGEYKVLSRQCDDIACEIFAKGNINIESKLWPNWTYNSIEDEKKSENERK